MDRGVDGRIPDLRYKACVVVDDPSLGLQLYYNLLWLDSFSFYVGDVKLRFSVDQNIYQSQSIIQPW